MKMHEYEVLPFDMSQRDEFLEGWFKLHAGNRKFADQMLSIIDTAPTSSTAEGHGKSVRFTQSPYILRLVCLSARRRKGGDFDRNEFLNRHDPLDDIIIAAGNREIQKTGITYSTQCNVLFALSLIHGDTFSVEDFRSTMQFYDLPEDTFEGMLTHHFIGKYGSKKSFLFKGMGDYLRAKALAEFIYKENDRFFGVEEYLTQINNLKDTSVEIFAGISSFYTNIGQLKDYFGAQRTRRHFRDRTAQGLIFLLANCGQKAFNLNRGEISDLISNILLGGNKTYEDLEFSCHFEGLDFRGVKFSHCSFKDVVFKDCTFDDGTEFHHCIFDGDFEVQGQSGFDDVGDKECMFNSMQARSTFDNRSSHASSRKVTPEDIKVLSRETLRLLRSSSGNFVDVSLEGVLSRLQRKNSYLASEVLNSMERNNVLRIKNGTKGHRARLEVDNIGDVLAFWNDGAEIGTIREAINQVSRKHCA